MTIMPNERRSRRSWMNSLISMAHVRLQKPPEGRGREARSGTLIGSRSLVIVACPAHEVDEHVLERRLGTRPREPGPVAIGCDYRFERLRVATGDVQARAERRHHVDPDLLGQV